VATYALSHAIALLADDRDFSMMRRAGATLLLAAP
jgi:hypothetical protein